VITSSFIYFLYQILTKKAIGESSPPSMRGGEDEVASSNFLKIYSKKTLTRKKISFILEMVDNFLSHLRR